MKALSRPLALQLAPGWGARPLLMIVLVLAVLAGSALRLTGLGERSLWEDELFSADLILNKPVLPTPSQAPFRRAHIDDIRIADNFWTAKAADLSPPLFELAGKVGVTLFGDSEAALRLTSALPATVLLAALAFLVLRTTDGAGRMALLSLLVLTGFSGMLIEYAREARVYGLGATLLTVAALQFWRRIGTGWRTAPLPGVTESLVSAAACLAHYLVCMPIGVLTAIYALEAWRRRDVMALGRLSAVPVATGAWLFMSHHSIAQTSSGSLGWTAAMPYLDAVHAAASALTGPILGGPLLIVSALVLSTALLAWRAADRHGTDLAARRDVTGALGLAALIGVYLLFVAYVTQKSHMMNPRYLIFIMPVVLMLVAACLGSVWRRWPVLAWALLACATATQIPRWGPALAGSTSDYRGAFAFVRAHLEAGDTVVVANIRNEGSHLYYLARGDKPLNRLGITRAEEARQLCITLDGTRRFGFVGSQMHEPFTHEMRQVCGVRYAVESQPFGRVFAQVWRTVP